MKKGIFEFWEEHPDTGAGNLTEQISAALDRRTYQDAQEDQKRAARLKASITAQMERGASPEIVLYSALELIGLYSADPEWTKAQRARLDAIYSGLEQQSLIANNAAIADARLKAAADDFAKQARKTIRAKIHVCERLENTLRAALQELDELDGGEIAD